MGLTTLYFFHFLVVHQEVDFDSHFPHQI